MCLIIEELKIIGATNLFLAQVLCEAKLDRSVRNIYLVLLFLWHFDNDFFCKLITINTVLNFYIKLIHIINGHLFLLNTFFIDNFFPVVNTKQSKD